MNTPNPLVPKGTTPIGGKTSLLRTVLTIVAVHVAFFGSLLMWGCGNEKPKTDDVSSQTVVSNNETTPVYPGESNATPLSNTAPLVSPAPGLSGAPVEAPVDSHYPAPVTPLTGSSATPVAPISPISPISQVSPVSPGPTPIPGATFATETPASEYVIAKGDTLADIATKKGVKLAALQAANPGVDPRKLRPGQKIQIPAATAPATTVVGATGEGGATTLAEGVEKTYTVKSGDTLTGIATRGHTTVKAIVALNGLKSQNSLKVGQKLKIPAAKASTSTHGAATTPVPPPVSAPTTSPAFSPAPLAPLSPSAAPAGVAK